MTKKIILILVLAVATALAAWAGDVRCPIHNEACWNTGQTKSAADGVQLHLYHCNCGDEYWIRD